MPAPSVRLLAAARTPRTLLAVIDMPMPCSFSALVSGPTRVCRLEAPSRPLSVFHRRPDIVIRGW